MPIDYWIDVNILEWSPVEVAAVDSIYREPKPIGQYFYRDNDFQWSEDSRYLYLIRDKYYESKGSQLFSSNGELWKYGVQTGDLQLVLKPFPAYTYFFGRNGGIYFSVPPAESTTDKVRFEKSKKVETGLPPPGWVALNTSRP